NPYDGEPYYNLGWSLKMQRRLDEAYEVFYKAMWNAAWQDASLFELARIESSRKNFERALYFAEKSIVRNYHGHSVRHLKTAMLRKLCRADEAIQFAQESLTIDPFNLGCIFEKYLLQFSTGEKETATDTLKYLKQIMRDDLNNYIEYALDYVHAGL